VHDIKELFLPSQCSVATLAQFAVLKFTKKKLQLSISKFPHHKFTVLKFTAMQLSMHKIKALIEGAYLVGFNEAGVHGPHRRLA
jgi:hypothetical protein